MPFYFGKSKDGSDMQEFEGMHVHPNGREWSNTKYPESVYIAYDANHPKHKHEYLKTETTNYSENGSITIVEWVCLCGKLLTP